MQRFALSAFAVLIGSASMVDAQVVDTVRIATGLDRPVYVCSPPGDTQRLFIVEQDGIIKIRKNGSILATPFLNIDPLVESGANEQGLLGLAFHPNYAGNGFFYVNYTREPDGATMVVRYTVSGNPDIADAGSALPIEGPIAQPQSNHNGGCLQFGADGKLYVAMGDGGNFNDTGTGHTAGTGNAQDGSNNLLGKILRLDVDNPPSYIPVDNPFVGNPSVDDEIWALGYRNPWRFSFDSLTGDMYVGDVGQGAREEIDFEPAGAGGRNYGWRCMEGFNCTGLSGCTCNAPTLTLPIHDFSHAGGNCSVTGGYVYRGCAIGGLQGTYFFADYCSARVWSFKYVGGTVTQFTDRTAQIAPDAGGGTVDQIASFGVDGNGEMYICDLLGELYQVIPVGTPDCNNNGTPDGCDIASGSSLDTNSDGIPDECQCLPPPVVYCTAKLNSLFCLPQIAFSGTAQISTPAPFIISASEMLNNKFGLLFYGYGQQAAAFQGGTLCVTPPIKRTTLQNSGGSGAGSDCTGTYAFDFKAEILAGTDPNLVPGATVNTQYWARDPGFPPPDNTSLTDAVGFTICN